MPEVWALTSFAIALGLALASFRWKDAALWQSAYVRAFVFAWFLVGCFGWWVSKRDDVWTGGLVVFIAWSVASACARRVPETGTRGEQVDVQTGSET